MTLLDIDLRCFWTKVNKTCSIKGCWLWLASTNPDDYGRFYLNGSLYQAHRISWLITHGTMPDLHVLHACDTPRCVNPKHLFLGTDQDNADDKVAKGRVPDMNGQDNPFAKATDEVIIEIRYLCSIGIDQTEVAKRFNLCREHVNQIYNNKRRKVR